MAAESAVRVRGRTIPALPGEVLATVLRRAGLELSMSCGGKGTCGTCRVRVVGGADLLPPPGAHERERVGRRQLAAGVRLACQVRIPATAGLEVALFLGGAVAAGKAGVGLVPARSGRSAAVSEIAVAPPSREDARGDLERVFAALPGMKSTAAWAGSPALLARLADILPPNGWRCRVAHHRGRLLGVLEPEGPPALGLAVDLGTTTVAVYLIDLEKRELLATGTAPNQQRVFGDDLMSRLAHARGANQELRRLAWDSVFQAVERTGEVDAGGRLVDAVLVGNPAMHHLALGLPTGRLAKAPYVAVAALGLELSGQVLDPRLPPWLRVRSLPLVGGFVGSDVLAGLVATGLDTNRRPTLYVDIGTNAEMAVITAEGLWACSAAAGPALEGARLECGMTAGPGAVVRALVRGADIETTTWDGRAPRGLSGTGALSLLASLRRAGMVDSRGLFVRGGPLESRLARTDGGVTLAVAPEVTLSEKDIAEIALARAAFAAGQQLLFREAGLRPEDLEAVVVAGTLGNEADPEDLRDLGLVPKVEGLEVRAGGNAAGAGAAMVLLDERTWTRVERLARAVRLVELSGNVKFQAAFVDSLAFP